VVVVLVDYGHHGAGAAVGEHDVVEGLAGGREEAHQGLTGQRGWNEEEQFSPQLHHFG